jgi:hypothetical protein
VKRGSFNDRVEKCIARFHDVETRSNEWSDRHYPVNTQASPQAKEPPRKG